MTLTTTMQPAAAMPTAASASVSAAGHVIAAKPWPGVRSGVTGDLTGFGRTNGAARLLGGPPT